MIIDIKKLDNTAVIPTRGSEYAAGYDLYSNEDVAEILPGETKLVGVGISMAIPDNFAGFIYARSGLASKQGLRPANCVGVVDSDYRGEIKVALHNDSNLIRAVNKGDRIAQLVIAPFLAVNFNEVDELNDTKRGEGGFGSTGINEKEEYEQLTLFNI